MQDRQEIEIGFGGIVKKQRTKRGLSQVELATIILVSPSYISRIESGSRKKHSYQIVMSLKEVLDIRD